MAGHAPAQHREAARLHLRLGAASKAGVYEVNYCTELLQVCGSLRIRWKEGSDDDDGNRAFTSLVAGTHMAPLGLTLLAVLARVYKIIRAERKEIEEEGEEVAQEEMVVEAPEEVKVNGTGIVVGPLTMEDFGETIRRDEKEEEEEKEEKEEEEEEGTVVPEKDVVITAKEIEVVAQKVATTSKVPLKRKRKNQGESITKAVEKEEETVAKKRKKVMEVVLRSPSPLPRQYPPPAVKESTIIRSKRKSEGVKKKKKRKKDEIDDLFAGLL